ncbi:MAG: hypothetical protein ACRED5_06035 [Propylenella sp.]
MRGLVRSCNAVAGAALVLLVAGPVAAWAQTGMGTPEDQKNIIAGICGTQIPLNPEGCVCFAKRAMTELSDPQRAYLILTVIQPPAAERLEIARSQQDLRTIALFIDAAQKGCAAVGGQAPGQPPAEGGAAPQ